MQKIAESVWRTVRDEYTLGGVSCRELAEKHNLSHHAVSTRCRRENWRQRRTDAELVLDRKLDRALDQKAKTLAERAQAFLVGAADDADGWLAFLRQAKARLDARDIEGASKLITAWRNATETGRKVFGLDREDPSVKVQIGVYAGGDCIRGVKGDIDA